MSLVIVEPTLNPGTVPHKMSSQVGHKSHQCPYCTYKTTITSNLRNHMRTHTGEKPFTCSYCPASFSTKERLKTHTFIHTGEKPFACSYCSHRTSRKDSLKIHVLTFHSVSPYWYIFAKYYMILLCLIWNKLHIKEKPLFDIYIAFKHWVLFSIWVYQFMKA